ncbi:MAG: HAMP domain-containing sensor histidine kinase, partial [Candidatus Baltobacteraceae bacterium]
IVVGIASWILAQISLRPLLEARERERTFIADAAHELRSPLATIASVAQAQRSDATNDGARDAFSLISSTALDASSLIGDLLTLARSPDATLLSREPVDLAAVVHTALLEFEPRAAAAQIQIASEVDSAIVNGDARRLRELIRNLLENAMQHARTRILVRCTAGSESALLQIIDDGMGVDAGDRERIFQRFFHGSNSISGSGLGLAIAQWVAHAHNGFLTLDETSGGASFTAQIPLLR